MSRNPYDRFLQQLVSQRNLTRQARWAEERQALRPLPMTPLWAVTLAWPGGLRRVDQLRMSDRPQRVRSSCR
jgi:hypothetical protein